ncbi:MAG: DUF1398 domain-containing protein [Bacteroidia bacterium]|nr:DUF1398 domain-containing protein [Bacteroidia bacterium]
MFTLDQIKAAHSKVKSGADFPNYIQDLIKLGVTYYETFVSDGHTVFQGKDNYQIASPPKYDALTVADKSNGEKFQSDLKAHQQGKTNYPTFCNDSAQTGIEKWAVDMSKMTCTYFDKAGTMILEEKIPS